jgi:hypothetical protein
MDKAFCHMQHDDVVRKDLFQVMQAFSKVKDVDGKMVGPAFKTMKSEFVVWQEEFSAKSMICMMKSIMTNPKEPSHIEIGAGRNRAG